MKRLLIWLMLLLVGVPTLAQDITFYKGQSVTFTIVFNNEYSPTRIQDINMSLNSKSIGKKSTGTIASTANPRAFRLPLSSATTNTLQYDYTLQVSIIDSALGVRYFAPLKVKVLTANGIVGNNQNLGSDFQINVTVNANVTTISTTTLSIYRGWSAYQVAVNNGFVGTEAAWLASFQVPKDTAVLARDQALAYRNSAAASAATATTQATNASNSAAAALASQNAAASTLANAETITNKQTDLTASATRYPTVNAVNTGLALKANLASPTFTGTPSLPTGTIGVTQTAGNSTTALATTAFVTTANNLKSNIANPTFTGKVTTPDILVSNLTPSTLLATDGSDNLVSLATATYPSLSELAFVKGLTSSAQTQINTKSNTASPTFTGTVTIPTLVATQDATINGVTVGEGGGTIASNTVVGLNALANNLIGINNTIFGANAGRFVTGDGNTFVGNTAGNATTTGSANTAVGRDALRNVIISGNNTALGVNAGRYLANGSSLHTNGDNSLFLGFSSRAAADNQTNQVVIAGANGVGLGSDTWVLGNNLTQFGRAWGNLLIGSSTNSGEALQVNGEAKITADASIYGLTVGRGGGAISNNTAVGNSVLNANLTGSSNLGVGFNALISSTSSHNTALGAYALQSQTTGSSNTAIGRFAFSNNITGTYNVAIGRDAGRYISDGTTALTVADNSIFIGGISKALADNGINQIAIGYNTTSLGDNTTRIGVSATTQTHLNGSLTIGSTTTLDASAIADFRSTTKGFLPPRMTTTQRNAIATPANGLQVFDTDLNRLMIYGGGFWGTIGALSGSYSTTGAATTSFVVTIGATMPNTTYKVNVTPTSSVAADRFFVSQASKTTTQFTVTYLTPLTGSVTFDWSVFR